MLHHSAALLSRMTDCFISSDPVPSSITCSRHLPGHGAEIWLSHHPGPSRQPSSVPLTACGGAEVSGGSRDPGHGLFRGPCTVYSSVAQVQLSDCQAATAHTAGFVDSVRFC